MKNQISNDKKTYFWDWVWKGRILANERSSIMRRIKIELANTIVCGMLTTT